MIGVFIKWFICVAGAWLLIVYGIRLWGLDVAKTLRKYFLFFCFVSWGVASMAQIGGSKPPTVKGITLARPVVTANDVTLNWTRDDGSNSVGRVYHVWCLAEDENEWKWIRTVDGTTSVTIPGFWAGKDYFWRVVEGQ